LEDEVVHLFGFDFKQQINQAVGSFLPE